eukprot:scaffold392283_cov25-Prasinocladus_malaysianus.AAC.1
MSNDIQDGDICSAADIDLHTAPLHIHFRPRDCFGVECADVAFRSGMGGEFAGGEGRMGQFKTLKARQARSESISIHLNLTHLTHCS